MYWHWILLPAHMPMISSPSSHKKTKLEKKSLILSATCPSPAIILSQLSLKPFLFPTHPLLTHCSLKTLTLPHTTQPSAHTKNPLTSLIYRKFTPSSSQIHQRNPLNSRRQNPKSTIYPQIATPQPSLVIIFIATSPSPNILKPQLQPPALHQQTLASLKIHSSSP